MVAEFEQEFAAYVGASFGRGVNTGTDALVVALRALEIGPGDEVITQANTFNASVAAIRLVGATPVLVDADECSFLIDDRQVESAISAEDASYPARPSLRPGHAHGGDPAVGRSALAGRRRRRGPGARSGGRRKTRRIDRAARLLQLPPEQEPCGAG